MDRQAYSRTYNQSKQQLRDAIKRFGQENPERFAELQAQARFELEHPQPRIVVRHTPLHKFNVDEFIRQRHIQSYYIHTKDCWGDGHLYFESLDNETPEEVLTRRHSKFAERREEITKVIKCACPLCV